MTKPKGPSSSLPMRTFRKVFMAVFVTGLVLLSLRQKYVTSDMRRFDRDGLREALASNDLSRQDRAALEILSRRDLELLLESLESERPSLHRNAARKFGIFRREFPTERFEEILLGLLRHDDPWVRSHAIWTCSAADSAEIILVLKRIAREDATESVRWRAASRLHELEEAKSGS